MSHKPTDTVPAPRGTLSLQTIAMPKDANANGDIFGGWLVSQMDLAAGVAARKPPVLGEKRLRVLDV